MKMKMKINKTITGANDIQAVWLWLCVLRLYDVEAANFYRFHTPPPGVLVVFVSHNRLVIK